MFAAENNGLIRIWIGYRKLKAVTIHDLYPFLFMDKCIENLKEAEAFSILDANSGYRHVEIDICDC